MDIKTNADLDMHEIINDVVEIQEEHEEIEACNDEIESAASDSEVLENVIEIVEKKEDGISPETVETLEVVTESIYKRLGITINKKVFATENFGQKMSKKEATSLVVEDLKTNLVRIWEAIKRAFSQMYLRIKNFIARLFNSFSLIEGTIKKLEDRVFALENNAIPSESQIENTSLGNAFSIDGGVVTSKSVEEILGNHTNVAKFFDNLSDEMESGLKYFQVVADNFNPDDSELVKSDTKKINDAFEKVLGFIRRNICPIQTTLKSEFILNGKVYCSEQMVNNNFYLVDTGKIFDVEYAWNFRSYGRTIKKASSTIRVSNKTEMLNILKQSKNLFDAVDRIKHREEFIVKFDKSAEKVLDAIIKKIKSNKDFANKEFIRSFKKSIEMYSQSFGRISSTIPVQALQAVSRSTQFVNLCLSYYNATPKLEKQKNATGASLATV